jgi:nitric oxide reductase subunit B
MRQCKRLWITLALVVAASFSVLGYFGHKAISGAPPIPREVVTTDGRVLFGGEFIRDGQNVWQSAGGQQVGSVFGHGAYVAPDWTADWLHREAVYTLDAWAREAGAADFDSLAAERQAPPLRASATRDARQHLRPRGRQADRLAPARRGD